MNLIRTVLLIILLIASSVLLYRKHKEKLRLQKELEEKLAHEREIARQKLYDFFKKNLPKIELANILFNTYCNLEAGYFTYYQMTLWKNQQTNLFNELTGKPFENIALSSDEVETISSFTKCFKNATKIRNSYNKLFIKEELKRYSNFFNSIEGRVLDEQQRTAIVTDDDNNIVITGAGSGKTTTMVGKVTYIIDRYKIAPEEILLISFTNKSASTLADRINLDGVEAKTFHKFGKDIIAEVEGVQPSIFDENQFKPLLTRYFTELIRKENYLKQVTEYFTDFLKPAKSPFEFENQGDYIQYIKDQNFKSYKIIHLTVNGRNTYGMEVVKSIEECKIANFLLFNSINYEYEYPYEYDMATETYRQYKPDFTIKQNDKTVYIEHFAVSRNGNVPRFFARNGESQEQSKARYWEKIYWAREVHEAHETTLIETYSYEMSEEILFANLTTHLEAAGIILKPKRPEEIWNIIREAAKDEVNSFITLFGTFITLMKSNNYSINNVINRNRATEDDFLKKRNALFIEIIKPIFERYESYLSERNEIDFSDMINKASNYISNGNFKRKFSYVLIDEFQDISIGRYQLIKAIKLNNPSCKLFCVGDDWQSIYRFSGSDIALFKEFENYFGFTVKSKIETTYRFQNPLLTLSSNFIQKNPNQAKKELKGISNINTSYKIQYSVTDNQDDTNAIQEIFNQLVATDDFIADKDIFILGRYGFDVDRIKNQDNVFQIDKDKGTVTHIIQTEKGAIIKLQAKFMTIHKAKGLEADIVIVLNCNAGKYGFPSEMSDDPVLNLLLSEADQFENGEERRLFYVAMSRAKESVFFVADSSYKSKFISELEIETRQSMNRKCPSCKTADVVLRRTGIARTGSRYKFYGCTNYLYGCEYTTTEWEN